MTKDATVTVVDVGHGNAAVVRIGNHVSIIDAGPRNTILEYCRGESISEIDTVMISHADRDHVEGLIALLSEPSVRIKRVLLNPDATKVSALWDDLAWELDQAAGHRKLQFQPSLTVADTGKIDLAEVRIEVLAPSLYLASKGAGSRSRSKQRLQTNSMSAVLRISRGTSVLACGDLDEAGLADLIAHDVDLRADVLIFPHHGGLSGSKPTAFVARLCERVQPSVVIFSIGRVNKPLNPRPEIVDAVRGAVPGVRVACTQLSLHCAVTAPDTEPAHLSPAYARGRLLRHCCGGTIEIRMGKADITPTAAAHAKFIADVAPTALCQRVLEN